MAVTLAATGTRARTGIVTAGTGGLESGTGAVRGLPKAARDGLVSPAGAVPGVAA